MKRIILFYFVINVAVSSFGQLTTTSVDGGSVVTNLGFGIKVNKGSSLARDWIVLNDTTCPIQIDKNTGINAVYVDSRYRFKPAGRILTNQIIVAFEIHHVLYDVFGGHIKTLSNNEITDISGLYDLESEGTWYASENQISEFLSCVSYVAAVRTKKGNIWRYKPQNIKEILSQIQISYDEGYSPDVSEEE